MEKVCLICKEEKDTSEFKVNKRNGDKILLRPYCRICDRAKQREFFKEYRNTTKYKEYHAEYEKKLKIKRALLPPKPPKVKREVLTKVCHRCKIEKNKSEFRTRIEKRYGDKEYIYLNNICKLCDNEVAKGYHNSLRDNPEYKEKNCKRTKDYCIKNREQVLAKQKIKRERPENKIRRKEYDKANVDRLRVLNRIRNQHYNRRIYFELTDAYAMKSLRSSYFHRKDQDLSTTYLKAHPEIILTRRREMVIRRLQKILKHF